MENNDFHDIADAALASAESLVTSWLPTGKKDSSGEYVASNPTRHDTKSGSFKINLLKGVWKDFASGDGGADLISLYAYLNSCSQLDALKAIADQLCITLKTNQRSAQPQRKVEAPPKARTDWVPIFPAPADAPDAPVAHPKRGRYHSRWCYKNEAGETLGYIYRFTTSDGGKDITPATFAEHPDGRREWRWMAFPTPRPLYGLDRLAAMPDVPVMFFEGEKCADAAVEVFIGLPCLSWPGGCNAVEKVDWMPVAGRRVIFWPDADSKREKALLEEDPETRPYIDADEQPGQKAAHKIAEKLIALGCKVQIVELPEPGTLPDGWDIADALADGWDAEQCKAFARNLTLYGSQNTNDGAHARKRKTQTPKLEIVDVEKPDEERTHWRDDLMRNDNGGLQAVLANAYLILSYDHRWDDVLWYDEFTCEIVKRKAPPFIGGIAGPWSDSDASKTLVWLQMTYGLTIRATVVADEAAGMVARDHTFHPVREWLASLPPWDGIPRLSYLLSEVFHAEQTEYTAHVGTGMLVTAVARVMDPGCQVDTMVVLESNQGKGKSSAIRELAGDAWYFESSEQPSSKDFLITIQGQWIIEIGEMQSFSKAETSLVKKIITCRNDKYRSPYDKYAKPHRRQCIFIGTCNGGQYLRDHTGGRRSLPIKCGDQPVQLAYLRDYREQFWAEALYQYKNGFQWWKYPEEYAQELQESRYEHDSWEDIVVRFLDGGFEADRYPTWVKSQHSWISKEQMVSQITVSDILSNALHIEVGRHDKPSQTRVGAIMSRLGWKRVRGKPNSQGFRAWILERPLDPVPPVSPLSHLCPT